MFGRELQDRSKGDSGYLSELLQGTSQSVSHVSC